MDVETLAHALGSSARQLERRFRATIGLGPKLVCRIARIRNAMGLLPLRNGQSWSDIVYACGFYDQAHFIREFRAIAGVTPGRFAHGCCERPTWKSALYNTAPWPKASFSLMGDDSPMRE